MAKQKRPFLHEDKWRNLVERFREYLVKQGHSINTVESYTRHVEDYMDWAYEQGIDPNNNREITHVLLNTYIRTINGIIKPRMVEAGINKYYLYKNAVFGESWTRVKLDVPRNVKNIQYVPTEEEIELLLKAPFKMRDKFMSARARAIVNILYSSAIREVELRAIKLQDLDLTLGNERILIHGKGRKERYVPLSDRAVVALKEYLPMHSQYKHKSEYLFFSRTSGKPLLHATVVEIFRRLKKLAGIEEEKTISPHAFRRHVATKWADMGLALHVIRAVMGHTNIAITSQYIESNSDKSSKAIRDAENEPKLSKEQKE